MKKTYLKNFCAAVIAFIILIPLCVSAQNPYGFNDEIMEFLNENNAEIIEGMTDFYAFFGKSPETFVKH